MKKTLFLTLGTLTIATFMTACGQSDPYVNTNIEAECATIQKKLLKIDEYIKTVEKTSAFHLEESSIAMLEPQMTVSNNKPKMLRDAAKRKTSLEAEQKNLGCVVSDK